MRRSDLLEDDELVRRAASGDGAAWQSLCDHHHPALVRYIKALGGADDPEDVAQDVWVQVMVGLRSLENPASFGAWLHTIARRTVYRTSRAKRRSFACDAVQALLEPDGEHEPSSVVIRDEDERRAWRALDDLRPRARALLVDRVVHELSPAEVAKRHALSDGSVHVALTRSRRLLREAYERLPSLLPTGLWLRWKIATRNGAPTAESLLTAGAGLAMAATLLMAVNATPLSPSTRIESTQAGESGRGLSAYAESHTPESLPHHPLRVQPAPAGDIEVARPLPDNNRPPESERFSRIANAPGVADVGWYDGTNSPSPGDVSIETPRGRIDVYVWNAADLGPAPQPPLASLPNDQTTPVAGP